MGVGLGSRAVFSLRKRKGVDVFICTNLFRDCCPLRCLKKLFYFNKGNNLFSMHYTMEVTDKNFKSRTPLEGSASGFQLSVTI